MKPKDATVFWLAASAGEIHFIDAILSAYDGVANVRRDYVLQDGRTLFKVYVGPGMEAEFLAILEALRPAAAIGEIVEGTDETPTPA